ncbi:MAG TPA: chemotaxis response regulator protein-glutamate methylesterase [Methylocella sp.]|nr:chemotaxis response regulator protein-glutamate methylesterase [Methylocella sp.]
MKPVRVLIVDDSATMRGLIRELLLRDPAIVVAGEAGDAHEARAAIKALNPDVITLDVEMPKMNGLEFLDKIMRLRPTPVIMVSSETASGAAAAITALEIGAFDCIAKPGPGESEVFAQALIGKVLAAAGPLAQFAARRARCAEPCQTSLPIAADYCPDGRLLAIGASTGGVEAITAILSNFPENCPPTLITQHMPPVFTKSFAERLDRRCRPKVSEAQDGAPLLPGRIYLAPGGATHLVLSPTVPHRCRLVAGDPVNGHRPSVDVLMTSVAKAAASNAIGVILTGMGRDGAKGLLAMRRAGARTLTQDEASCLIYGMPKAAFECGGAETQLPLDRIASEILRISSSEQKEKNDAFRVIHARPHRR